MRSTRRRFLAGSAAAVCVGCSAEDDAVTVVSSRTASTGAGLDRRSAGSTPDVVPAPVFGAPTVVGPLDELQRQVRRSPVDVAAARAWVVHVADDEIDPMRAATDERLHRGIGVGLMALHQKCPHLGCRVPFCESSGWFECPCHGSTYTRLGEHRDGPGPRGLDAFAITISDDAVVSIASAEIVAGLPVGTVVVDSPRRGPSCFELLDP